MDAHDYIQAAKAGTIMDRTQEDRTEIIRTAVSRAFSLKGLPLPSGVDYELITTEVERKIVSTYPYMTGPELTYITERGVSGELTKETRPTASAIFGWMAAYMNGEERKEALRTYQRSQQWNNRQQSEISQAEKDELNRRAEVRALRTLWQEFKDSGRFAADHLDGYIAMACDAFIKRRYMTVTDEHWRMAKEAARKEAQRSLGSGWINRALPYDPVFKTKRIMLAMCFQGLKDAGYELTVDA